MTRIYLITGFLGAGKTTFLKEFVRLFRDQRISVIVNEFGKAGVDGALLAELGLTLAEIANGSIFCVCQLPAFERTLGEQLAAQPDVIVVEASGLADPTSVGGILGDRQRFPGADYAGAICLIDAARFRKVYETARIVKRQIAVSDAAVINKTDLADEAEIAFIERELRAMKPDMAVFRTSFGKIGPEIVGRLLAPAPAQGPSLPHIEDVTLQKLTLDIGEGFTRETFSKFLAMFAEETYRMKGFVRLGGELFLADCVGPLVKVTPWDGAAENVGALTVLYGNGLRAKSALAEAMRWYPDCGVGIRP
ncbi:MAG: GTP-binding protein [Oscillospiraceae bacterium]|nr:GTP-binding protein [Oscillospiraceae bacterium]